MTQKDEETYPGPYINHMAGWWHPLEPSTIVSCQTSRLTSQKAACSKRDRFSGKERSCWHNGPGKPNIIAPVQKDHNSSVWIIPWISSKEGSGTRRPELRTQSIHLEAFTAHQLHPPTPSFPEGCKPNTIIKSKKKKKFCFSFNN